MELSKKNLKPRINIDILKRIFNLNDNFDKRLSKFYADLLDKLKKSESKWCDLMDNLYFHIQVGRR